MTNPNDTVEALVAECARAISDILDCDRHTDPEIFARAIIPLVLEFSARVAEQQAADFMSPEYAYPQPLGSIQERFACAEVAREIRDHLTEGRPSGTDRGEKE